ncbi:HIT family protein [bacterium]|nr:HIT family protein [candidate division CSSED10-310 bacterium]
MTRTCPFCDVQSGEILFKNELAMVLIDQYPVARGHLLVVPKRHFGSYFDAIEAEIAAIHRLILKSREYLENRFNPKGYNIGVNVGRIAGQSIFHMHVHVIPRYEGDHPHPRGGVRNIIPRMGDYPA